MLCAHRAHLGTLVQVTRVRTPRQVWYACAGYARERVRARACVRVRACVCIGMRVHVLRQVGLYYATHRQASYQPLLGMPTFTVLGWLQ